jgi:hypothetical protein
MALKWPAKEESEVRPYGIDWAARLGTATILTSVFAVTVGTVVINSQTNTTKQSTCVISGGKNGECANLTCKVTTSDGYTYEETVELPVRALDDLDNASSTTTKRQLIDMAAEICGLPGYSFTASPTEISSWLRRLDTMMNNWAVSGLAVGYNFPVSVGASDPDDASGIPDYAVDAAAGGLANSIAPGLGKTISREARVLNTMAMTALRTAKTQCIPVMKFPHGTPRGAGSKSFGLWQPFIVNAVDEGCC